MNRADNYNVLVIDLIYSPSDTPKGLWRGFAFMGSRGRRGHAG
jgi:hypothetical protein